MFFAIYTCSDALAQRCDTDYEQILTLSSPQIGSYSVWDAVYGEQEYHERFVGAESIEGWTTVMVGERSPVSGGDMQLSLIQFERRGRKDWSQFHDIDGLNSVVKLLKTKEGFVVATNRKKKGKAQEVWIGFFDKKGYLKSSNSIRDQKHDLKAHDFLFKTKNSGFKLLTSVKVSDGSSKSHTRIYNLNSKGKVENSRAYMIGVENQILDLEHAHDNRLIASGYILGEDGRKNGWVMMLDWRGSIIWQRQYPRGAGAVLKNSVPFINDHIVVGGQAFPSDEGNTAGWLMALHRDSGNIAWQRYYNGDIHYEINDLMVNSDHVISVLLNGNPGSETIDQDYVRILSVNPRGFLIMGDEYFNGEAADGFQFLLGPANERIIVGSTIIAHQIEIQGQKEVEVRRSQDGWILVGTPADTYDDPCL